MKKNVMMRIASVLLIAVLLTTSAVSGTYAKYTTSGSGTDSARVAKWGVDIVATGNAFHGYYYGLENGNGIHADYNASTDTVKSQGGDVVAPGTHGDAFTFTLTGTPEVDFNVNYSAEFSIGTNWTDGTKFYCPLIIHVTKLDGTVESISGINYENAAAFANKVNEVIASCSFSGKAGTDLSTLSVSGSRVSVSWEWPFETTIDGQNCNEKDTHLGNLAADANDQNNPSIYLKVTCTIEQVD